MASTKTLSKGAYIFNDNVTDFTTTQKTSTFNYRVDGLDYGYMRAYTNSREINEISGRITGDSNFTIFYADSFTDSTYKEVIILSDQEVDSNFYNWFIANTTIVSTTTLDLSTLSDISDGTHTVKVKAKADGYRDSEFSNEVEWTKSSGSGFSGHIKNSGNSTYSVTLTVDEVSVADIAPGETYDYTGVDFAVGRVNYDHNTTVDSYNGVIYNSRKGIIFTTATENGWYLTVECV